ncbi:MAG: preprotein translocase subunit SecG [Candidatus Moranbacteria bacterium]|nr:preprotein translocase subunit SecG [Candidatus Moranbacteria bacterium]
MDILIWSQLIISILLIGAVLLQNRGSGLSNTFGGGGGGFHTKRGVEKFLFTATIVLGTLFILNSIAFLVGY